MPTIEEYAKQTRDQRMHRLGHTADELGAAIDRQSDATLSRRPDAVSWSAKEVVCHLRDVEEAFAGRFEQILVMDVEPTLVVLSADRRAKILELFAALTPAQWDKAGIHPVQGRITIDGFLSFIAWHDDNHLDQLARALAGRI